MNNMCSLSHMCTIASKNLDGQVSVKVSSSKLWEVRNEPFQECVGLGYSGFYWEIGTYETDGDILGIERFRDGLGRSLREN